MHIISFNWISSQKVQEQNAYLKLITDFWKPIIIGELNNQQVRLVKIKGEFVMHHHDNEDEFFLVVKGLL